MNSEFIRDIRRDTSRELLLKYGLYEAKVARVPIQIDLGPGSPKAAEKKVAPRGPVVGIDLGTTNSLIAIAMGSQARVIQDSEGRALTPSVVRINEQSGRVETIGNIAKADKAAHFASTTFSIKRFMGKSFEEVSHEAHQLPFELVGDSASGQVQIRVGEKNFSPIELSAEILKHLKARAEETLGEKVERAVVTVPAYFDDAQRAATKAAGRLAGLDVLRILNEPTAAALAYGWDNQRPGRIAVYDLGGGTFDISVLRIEENVFEVLSTSGDTHLGGDDFDWALANWALAGYAAKNPNARPKDENEQKKLVGELLTEAERVKLELSAGTNAEFSLRGEKFSISRADAEKLWDPLIERTLAACRQALADARIEAKDLKDVLLVGGSTRVPRVRERVKEFFGREPNTTLNPDEAVALGAALQAENLGTRATEHLLLDVIPLSLGIETMGGTVSKLIPRNSTIPCEARENFTNHADKQTAFDFHIVQGERELIKDCRSLARFKLRGLEPAPAGFHRIEVLFRIDANGILNVRARDLRSGKAQEIEVKPSFGISEDELTRMLEASIDNAESDMAARQLVDLKMEAQTVIAAGEKAVKISGHMVSTDELGEIRARLIDLKNAAHGSSLETLQRSLDTFNEVTRELAELQVNQALQSSLEGKDTRKL